MELVRIDSTFWFSIINILVLYIILKKILFKPVTAFMENRAKSIEKEINTTKEKLKEAENLRKQYDERLKLAYTKADEIINEAKKRANTEYEKIIEKAHKDSEIIISRANQVIDTERQQMKKEVKNEVADLSFIIASKLLQKNINKDVNAQIIEKYLVEKGVN